MIRLPTIYAAVFAGTALLAPATASACNPLEALFGACRMDVFRPSYQVQPEIYRPAPEPRRIRARKVVRVKAVAHDELGVSMKETPIEPTADAPMGSLELFRKDPTLRSGDVVVTNDGFRIYRHGEFSGIAAKGKLAELERASMKTRARPVRLQTVADRRR